MAPDGGALRFENPFRTPGFRREKPRFSHRYSTAITVALDFTRVSSRFSRFQ
jgi:hypothetical protein